MNLALLTGFIMTANLFNMMGAAEPKTTVDDPQKKEQRVMVIVKKEGKEIKIDTTFNLADEKVVQAKVDSILKVKGVKNIHADGKNVVIMKSARPSGVPGQEEVTVFIQKDDSAFAGGKKVVRVHKDGNMTWIAADGEMIPPPPPPPAPPVHFKTFKFHGDPFAFDPNDDDIITYDKKDIGKGLEKIIIVRKKRDANAPAHVVEGVKIEQAPIRVEGKKIEIEEPAK
jgi:hypothetical protein